MSEKIVANVKASLLAAGENIDGNCGAFKITSRVAWLLRAEGWGLVFSTGNGCIVNGINYRTDTLMKQDGSVKDCLIKAGDNEGQVFPDVGHDTYNIPAWLDTGNQPPANWRPPFNPGDIEEPEEPGEPDEPSELDKLILFKTEQINADTDDIQTRLGRIELLLDAMAKELITIRDEARTRGYWNAIIRNINPR